MSNKLAVLQKIDAHAAKFREMLLVRSSDSQLADDVAYTFESNRIEGNTLSLSETLLVVQQDVTIPGKTAVELQESRNHYEAICFIRDALSRCRILDEFLVKNIHGILLHRIDQQNTGRYRQIPVQISKSQHVPPQPWQLEKLMEDLFHFYEKQKCALHPVELAAEMHERLVSIHPFIDGNGRCSRLVMNFILLENGYPILNLSGEDADRQRYYDALELTNVSKNPEPFVMFIAEHVLRSVEKQLKLTVPAPGRGR